MQWWGTAFAFKLRHAPSPGPSAYLGGGGFRRKRKLRLPILLSRGIPHGVYVGGERAKGKLFEALSSVSARSLFMLGVS